MPKRRGTIGTATSSVTRADLKPNQAATDRQLQAQARATIRRAQKQKWTSGGRNRAPLPPLSCLTAEQTAFLKDRDARRAARNQT